MWQTVVENLLPLFVTVVTPVLLCLAHRALDAMAKRGKLQAAVADEDTVDELSLKGIKAAEKKARNALKTEPEKKTDGQKKLEEAMQFVNAQLRALKLDEKASSELIMLIEAKLFDGASKPVVTAGDEA